MPVSSTIILLTDTKDLMAGSSLVRPSNLQLAFTKSGDHPVENNGMSACSGLRGFSFCSKRKHTRNRPSHIQFLGSSLVVQMFCCHIIYSFGFTVVLGLIHFDFGDFCLLFLECKARLLTKKRLLLI